MRTTWEISAPVQVYSFLLSRGTASTCVFAFAVAMIGILDEIEVSRLVSNSLILSVQLHSLAQRRFDLPVSHRTNLNEANTGDSSSVIPHDVVWSGLLTPAFRVRDQDVASLLDVISIRVDVGCSQCSSANLPPAK